MRKVSLLGLVVGIMCAAHPGAALALSRVLVANPVSIQATGVRTIPLLVTELMPKAKLAGHLVAAGGSGNDIEVLVLRQVDYENWRNGHAAPALFESGRKTVSDFDIALEPGSYTVVLSNSFSSFTAKSVSGTLTLSWPDDPALPQGLALKKSVNFKPLPKDGTRYELTIRAGTGSGKVVITREPGSYSVTVRRPEGTTTLERTVGTLEPYGIEEAGTFDVDSDGVEDLFVVGSSVGTGGRSQDLTLVATTKLALLTVSLFESSQATERVADVAYSDNFSDPRFAAEQSFLDRIRSAYAPSAGTEAAVREDDPKNIFYTWAKDNGTVKDGSLTIRRYAGKPAEFGSVNDEITDGTITYRAYFKAGVIAYDSSTNEHYALFHPKEMYAWPTVLKKLGPFLIIGTRGEGLAIVDTKRLTLQRVRLGPRADDVEKLEVVGSRLRVNGETEVDAPSY